MYRRRSKERKDLRMNMWNYSNPGWYFITICTKGDESFFGEIRNGIMGLNEIGIIINNIWNNIPEHFEGVVLDRFVVMPNHVHGIVVIGDNSTTIVGDAGGVDGGMVGGMVGDADLRPLRNPPTQHGLRPLRNPPTQPDKMLLPKIIHGFKSTVSRQINRQFPDNNFEWHRSYYDHIIRHHKALDNIRDYIYYNPVMWNRDRNNDFN